jgi:hypothetical protein
MLTVRPAARRAAMRRCRAAATGQTAAASEAIRPGYPLPSNGGKKGDRGAVGEGVGGAPGPYGPLLDTQRAIKESN